MVPSSGRRIGWLDIPPDVRLRIERIVGGRVVDAVSQAGGFSPGTADRVRTDNGRCAFVKAVVSRVSRLPPPPGIPAVRAFQRWQFDALLPWLRERLP
jgi:hypothetical protein